MPKESTKECGMYTYNVLDFEQPNWEMLMSPCYNHRASRSAIGCVLLVCWRCNQN